MNVVVTVFQQELKGKAHLLKKIEKMASQLNLVVEAYVIIPKAGQLFELLQVLRENSIAYGTHFNSSELDSPFESGRNAD